MLVSVIIPCHNAEKYIAECIESVMTQTYRDIEMILVENNSSDSTLKLLHEFSTKYPDKVKVLTETKPGASLARNAGLSIAKGEWVQFLDADDLLLPNKISNQVQLVSGSVANLVAGNYLRIENCNTEKIFTVKNSWEGLIIGRLGVTSSNLWRKSSLLAVGGWDDIKSSQEAMLMFKLLQQNNEVIFDDEFNAIKMERSNLSISKTNVKDNIIRYIELRIAIWKYLQSTGNLTEYLLRVLKINVFDSIKILYTENAEAGLRLYNEYVKHKFKPIQSSSTSFLYLVLYKVAGFRMVQNIIG